MKSRTLLGLTLACLAAVATVYAADEIKLDGVKCVVASGKDAKADKSVDYKGAKVFFCCANCPKAFAADTAKFAAKANHQLVATKQAKQTACPFSGEDVDPATKIKVAGTEVGFCCAMCKGKAEASKDQVELIFNDKSFEKGFKVGAKQ